MTTYKSPLAGYENAEPLPTGINKDGKSLVNIPAPLSDAYETFPKPIDSSNNGFDFHSACTGLACRCMLKAGMQFTSCRAYRWRCSMHATCTSE
jgi:hypothetical protein